MIVGQIHAGIEIDKAKCERHTLTCTACGHRVQRMQMYIQYLFMKINYPPFMLVYANDNNAKRKQTLERSMKFKTRLLFLIHNKFSLARTVCAFLVSVYFFLYQSHIHKMQSKSTVKNSMHLKCITE